MISFINELYQSIDVRSFLGVILVFNRSSQEHFAGNGYMKIICITLQYSFEGIREVT